MKKFSVMFFALILALFCVACGSTTADDNEDEGEGNKTDTGDTGDTIHDGDTDTGDTEEDTGEGEITKIQKGITKVGATVTTECVVTGIAYNSDSTTHENTSIKGLYVSELIDKAEPYSGIYVFIKDTALVDEYEIGNKLKVTGTYKEYYENSQIESSEIIALGKADVPEAAEIEDPATIATPFENQNPTANHGDKAEEYEGVLVKVTDVEITNAALDTHGTFEVTGNLAIDKELFYYPKDKRTVGRKFKSIQGILIYSYNAFRLAPRSIDDFEEDEDSGDTDTCEEDDCDTVPSDIIFETVTIKDVQSGKAKDKNVQIEKAVVISPAVVKDFDGGGKGYSFYVSDGTTGDYSGLYIYNAVAESAPEKGDEVTINGKVLVFKDKQWEIGSQGKGDEAVTCTAKKTGSGKTVPAAVKTNYTALSDKDKGTLTEIEELEVKSVETPEGKNYTKITFAEKVDGKELVAENFGNVKIPTLETGDKVAVTGIYDAVYGEMGFFIIDANDIKKK